VVFQRGDPCVGFHALVYGQVKLGFVSPQGAEKVVEIIHPGQSFGEALMFTDRPYVVFAQCLADSLMLHIEKAAIDAEIERDPRLARRMIAGLSMPARPDPGCRGLFAALGHAAVIGYCRDIDEHADPTAPLRIQLATEGRDRLAAELTPSIFRGC
jgi:hypothetical protein